MISKIQNKKALGTDRITGFWYKSLYLYHLELALSFNKAFNGLIGTPEWLFTRVLTYLLPKTHLIPETLKYWFGVQRSQSYLMWKRCHFSLVWPPL